MEKTYINVSVFNLTDKYTDKNEEICINNKDEFVKYLNELVSYLTNTYHMPFKYIHYGNGFGVAGFWGEDDWSEIETVNADDINVVFEKCADCFENLDACSFVLDFDGLVFEIGLKKTVHVMTTDELKKRWNNKN